MIKVINSLFEVKTQDRLACVTEQIFWGKNPSSGTSAKRLEKVDRAGVNAGVCSLFLNPPFIGNAEKQTRGAKLCVWSQVSGCVSKETETQACL